MKIDSFQWKYRFLSNFYPAKVILAGDEYPTVEHAYQAAKTTNVAERDTIRGVARPGEAKKLGKLISTRDSWNQIKLNVMKDLVQQKFFKHRDLKRRLLDTKDSELIEGNWWGDRFWGVCEGEGENHLGKILMEVRDSLRVNLSKPR